MLISFSRPIAIFAVKQLSNIDYTIANRVTEDVSQVVEWAYSNDLPWLATRSVELLRSFDNIGSLFISIVIWILQHTS